MDYVTVLKQIEDHLANCKRELHAGNGFQAESHLVKLRELLNSQPELDTNSVIVKCRVCGCTDSSACPSGCYWIEAELCSACAHGFCEQIKKGARKNEHSGSNS